MSTSRKSGTVDMLMNKSVKTLTEETSLADAIRFLVSHEISSAPVVKEAPDGRKIVVGMLTEKDCIDRLADEMFFGSPRPTQTVATMMKRHPVCVAPDNEVFSLLSLFASHGLRHAPVTEEDGHLVGMVSRRDILKFINSYYDQELDSYAREHFPPDLRKVSNLRFFSR